MCMLQYDTGAVKQRIPSSPYSPRDTGYAVMAQSMFIPNQCCMLPSVRSDRMLHRLVWASPLPKNPVSNLLCAHLGTVVLPATRLHSMLHCHCDMIREGAGVRGVKAE